MAPDVQAMLNQLEPLRALDLQLTPPLHQVGNYFPERPFCNFRVLR